MFRRKATRSPRRAARGPAGTCADADSTWRGLVVEEEVRLELAQERPFVEAAQEHRLVDLDVPVHQRADRALVRGRSSAR